MRGWVGRIGGGQIEKNNQPDGVGLQPKPRYQHASEIEALYEKQDGNRQNEKHERLRPGGGGGRKKGSKSKAVRTKAADSSGLNFSFRRINAQSTRAASMNKMERICPFSLVQPRAFRKNPMI